MPVKNKRIVKKIIEVFDNNDYNTCSNYLDEDIKWNIVGMPVISGKGEFIKAVNSLELENFTSSKIKNIISEGEFVVVESTGRVITGTGNPDTPAYCDIYRIKDSKICERTTYIVDASSHIES